jgi:hypothetical protein
MGLINSVLKKRNLLGDDDAKSIAMEAFWKAMADNHSEYSEEQLKSFLYKSIDGKLLNYIKTEKIRKGMTVGKGRLDDIKADEIKIKNISGDAPMRDKDGSDSRETFYSTTDSGAERPGDETSAEKKSYRKRNIDDIIDDEPNEEAKKIVAMMYAQVKRGYDSVKFIDMAKDWYKNEPDDKIEPSSIRKHGSVEKAREAGIDPSSLAVKVKKHMPYLRAKFHGLQESKIDVLALYIRENANLAKKILKFAN